MPSVDWALLLSSYLKVRWGKPGVAELEFGDLDSLCRLYTESYILHPTKKRLACDSTALMVGFSLDQYLASHAFLPILLIHP